MAKRIIRKRKRICTLTIEGQALQHSVSKLKQAIPDKKKRQEYLTALINEFDERIKNDDNL